VSVIISDTSPFFFRSPLSHKLKLFELQLSSLYYRLSNDHSRYNSLTFFSFLPSNPLLEYDLFYFFLMDSIASLLPSSLPPSRKRSILCFRLPASWWNDVCAQAASHRRTFLHVYKSSSTLDNWRSYQRESVHYRKTLRMKKLLNWRRLCSEFSYKAPC